MSNVLTVSYAPKLPGAAQGASSTDEFQFNDTSGTPAKLTVRPGVLKNRVFKIRVAGHVTGGTTTNFTVNLDKGTSTTIGDNTTFFTSGAIAVNSASGAFYLEVMATLDSVSKIVQGCGEGMLNNTAVTRAAITALTSVDPDTEIGFTVTGTFSASHASNAAVIDHFEIETL